MLLVCDPATLLTVAAAGSALTTAASALVGGATARRQAELDAAAAKTATAAAARDTQEQFDLDASRIRAILSAAGGSDTEMQTLLAANAREAAAARTRLLQDRAIRLSSARTAGRVAGIDTAIRLVGAGAGLATGLANTQLLKR